MIRIESHILHELSVPLHPDQGNRSKMLRIPPMIDGKPGVLEVAELDAVTIARLRWHYEERPIDGNSKDTREFDDEGAPRFNRVGLLKITLVKDGVVQSRTSAEEAVGGVEPLQGKSTKGLEPQRKAKKSRKRVA